jgi:hypothetical protein
MGVFVWAERWVLVPSRLTGGGIELRWKELIPVPDGPIEFVSDPVGVDEKASTEFGGVSGLVQPLPHEMDGSEKRGVLVRSRAATKADPLTGLVVPDESAMAVDPVTGLLVDPAWNEDGATGKPVDSPPLTGDPRAGTL